jgi:hypothetical protein
MSQDFRRVNITFNFDGHVIRLSKGIVKLMSSGMDETEAVEHVIAEAIKAQYGIEREMLGDYLQCLAENATWNGGDLLLDVIDMQTEWSYYDLQRDQRVPYRVIERTETGWRTIDRCRTYQAAHQLLMFLAKRSTAQTRIECYWNEDGEMCNRGIREVVMLKNGVMCLGKSRKGAASIDDMDGWCVLP